MLDSLTYVLTWIYNVAWVPVAKRFMHIVPPELALLLLLLLVFVISPVLAYHLLKRLSLKKRLVVVAAFIAGLAVLIGIGNYARSYQPRPVTFDGESTKLSRTQIVSTLDTPVEPGKNVIWCASFQAAWKMAENDVVKEPIELRDAAQACARLNESPTPEVPEGTLYATAGWVSDGILNTIRQEQAKRFPGSTPPEVPNVRDDALVAYGHLESQCAFPIPYFDCTYPVTFTDSAGNKSEVRTFGIRGLDDPMRRSLRKQVNVLVGKGTLKDRPDDFVVDLCRTSKDTQVVFASVPFAGSLKEVLATVAADIANAPPDDVYHGELGDGLELLIPEIAYWVAHDFSELEGRDLLNKSLVGTKMETARQDIQFRLDCAGAKVMARAMIAIPACMVLPMRGDKPFLVYLKKRGAALPYFVMWVDNSELLMKWE